MLDGLHRFVERKIDESVGARAKLWKRDPSSREAYERSIRANRESFRKIIGVVDPRLPAAMERFGDDDRPGPGGRGRQLPGLPGALAGPGGRPRRGPAAGAEGRGAGPRRRPARRGPDAGAARGPGPGVAPESQFARRLAANGFRVVVPTLISRGIEFSGNPRDRDDQPAAPRVDLPPGVPDGPARHRLRGAEGPGRGGLDRRPGGAGGEGRRRRLRRGRPDRLLRRGRGPADRRGPGQRLLRPAAAGLGRADLPQRLGPAPRVRRRRGRHPDRPARAGRRAQRGAARRRAPRRAEGAARRGRGGRARHAGTGRRPRANGSGSKPSCPRASRSASSSTGTASAADGFVGPEAVREFARLLGVDSKMELPGAAPADRRKGFSTRTSASGARSRSWRTTSSTCSAVPTRCATRSSSGTRR